MVDHAIKQPSEPNEFHRADRNDSDLSESKDICLTRMIPPLEFLFVIESYREGDPVIRNDAWCEGNNQDRTILSHSSASRPREVQSGERIRLLNFAVLRTG